LPAAAAGRGEDERLRQPEQMMMTSNWGRAGGFNRIWVMEIISKKPPPHHSVARVGQRVRRQPQTMEGDRHRRMAGRSFRLSISISIPPADGGGALMPPLYAWSTSYTTTTHTPHMYIDRYSMTMTHGRQRYLPSARKANALCIQFKVMLPTSLPGRLQ